MNQFDGLGKDMVVSEDGNELDENASRGFDSFLFLYVFGDDLRPGAGWVG